MAIREGERSTIISRESRSSMWQVGPGGTRPYLPPTALRRQEATAKGEWRATSRMPRLQQPRP